LVLRRQDPRGDTADRDTAEPSDCLVAEPEGARRPKDDVDQDAIHPRLVQPPRIGIFRSESSAGESLKRILGVLRSHENVEIIDRTFAYVRNVSSASDDCVGNRRSFQRAHGLADDTKEVFRVVSRRRRALSHIAAGTPDSSDRTVPPLTDREIGGFLAG